MSIFCDTSRNLAIQVKNIQFKSNSRTNVVPSQNWNAVIYNIRILYGVSALVANHTYFIMLFIRIIYFRINMLFINKWWSTSATCIITGWLKLINMCLSSILCVFGIANIWTTWSKVERAHKHIKLNLAARFALSIKHQTWNYIHYLIPFGLTTLSKMKRDK